MNETNLKFTIIIPTKERSDTLKWSLKTCLEQDYENLEIIVSDNFSQDDTREVVESFRDERLRYLNTGKPLSMSSNFEFALSHATGDYIGFIGDDDGLMPNSITGLNEFCQKNDPDAVSWRFPVYGWGNLPTAAKNTLSLPLSTPFKKKGEPIKIDARKRLEEVLEFKSTSSCYWDLVWLYHGFVKSEILFDLRDLTGRFFNSINPDVYASVAISCVIQHFWQIPSPCSIVGASHHSTSAWKGGDYNNVDKFYQENDIPFHPNLKKAFSLLIYTAEAFLKAREIVPEAKQFDFNVTGLIEKSMEEAVETLPGIYDSIADSVRHIGEVYGLQDVAEKAIAENPNNPRTGDFMLSGYNFLQDFLIVKFDEEKVSNIYEASLECNKILEKRSLGLYAVESSRFVLSGIKNYGIGASVKRALRRATNA